MIETRAERAFVCAKGSRFSLVVKKFTLRSSKKIHWYKVKLLVVVIQSLGCV